MRQLNQGGRGNLERFCELGGGNYQPWCLRWWEAVGGGKGPLQTVALAAGAGGDVLHRVRGAWRTRSGRCWAQSWTCSDSGTVGHPGGGAAEAVWSSEDKLWLETEDWNCWQINENWTTINQSGKGGGKEIARWFLVSPGSHMCRIPSVEVVEGQKDTHTKKH